MSDLSDKMRALQARITKGPWRVHQPVDDEEWKSVDAPDGENLADCIAYTPDATVLSLADELPALVIALE